jgi:hypothetical protein
MLREVSDRAKAIARRGAVMTAQVAPALLVVAALAIMVIQPWPDPLQLDALVAIAGIVATVLSLGFAVTLLVAQHTAERHARALYAEFRREGAWLRVLGWLAVGVVVIVAASLLWPTLSTAYASLLLVVALGLYAASLLPHLLDSLDATRLAERLTDRSVRELNDIARSYNRLEVDTVLKPVASQAIEIASGIAVQGIASNDKEVARAGFAGMRRVLVAYVEGSPTRGWDTVVINLAFQHIGEAVDRCVKEKPVTILPAVIEELTALGVESQRTLEVDGNEAISLRLNGQFFDIVRDTLTNEASPGAAMATRGIGESALALIRAQSPNMVADHIKKLRSIAAAAIRTNQDHVTGAAHVELSKIAIGLAGMDMRDVMPASLFQEACDAFGNSVNEFIGRTTSKGGLMDDIAWSWVTMAHAEFNLAWVVVAGLAARGRGRDRYGTDFDHGATSLVVSLVKLSNQKSNGFMTQGHALETAYMAVIGSMGLKPGRVPPDLIPKLWSIVVRRLVDPSDKETLHEVDMLSTLLLHGTYQAVSSGPSTEPMRAGVEEALKLTTGIADKSHRRRRSRAWLAAGRAALGSGDRALAMAIAAAIAPDVRVERMSSDAVPWRVMPGEDDDFLGAFFSAAQPMPRPKIPSVHKQPEVIAEFKAMLDKPKRPRRRRPPASPPPRPPEDEDDHDEADESRGPATPPSGLVGEARDRTSGRGARPTVQG